VTGFIDEHRARLGVEPICRVLGVSASAYYQRASGERSKRAVEDERLLERIRELHAANYFAYGSRRMWKALRRGGESVGRCRVERLMRAHGLQGAKRRGKPWRTTMPDPLAQRRPDLVQRDLTARGPNRLWLRQNAWQAAICGESLEFVEKGALESRSRSQRSPPPIQSGSQRIPFSSGGPGGGASAASSASFQLATIVPAQPTREPRSWASWGTASMRYATRPPGKRPTVHSNTRSSPSSRTPQSVAPAGG
jgi:hypothetical protein